jgi:hypothetical protein
MDDKPVTLPPGRRRWAPGDDDVDILADQLGSHLGEPIGLPAGKSPLNDEVLSFNIPKLTHPFAESHVTGRGSGTTCT